MAARGRLPHTNCFLSSSRESQPRADSALWGSAHAHMHTHVEHGSTPIEMHIKKQAGEQTQTPDMKSLSRLR